MDLQVYFRKMREIEDGFRDAAVVVVSLETPDGGRAGLLTETPRRTAARMIVEGTARAATEEEARDFRERNLEAKRQAEQLAAAARVQLTVVSAQELKKLKNSGQTGKD